MSPSPAAPAPGKLASAPAGAWWPGLRAPALVPLLYLAGVALAELLTAAVEPRLGLPLHALLLLALLGHGALVAEGPRRALLWALALAPLIRILSLSLPVASFPLVYWYAIISLPVFAAAFAAARTLGYSRRDLGLVLQPRDLPLALGMLLLGGGLGVVEYVILRPQPLARSLALDQLWLPALILTISTGLEKELVFRGLLQRAAQEGLGPVRGLLYVTALFASLHIGYLSLADLGFVFVVGLLFAVLAWRTGSILAATAGHASVNVSLFLLVPFLLPGGT